MHSSELRRTFIEFFKGKGHAFAPASPVVPQNDPTLLFTNAGMNQFKDIFLGEGSRDYTRAVNSQPCIRVSGKHNDLEDVGFDGTHLTLFEMLGNWSFGDYYKKEAIRWAWELLTEKLGFPKEKLYATVYKTDDEAMELWRSETDIRPDHILRFGEKDNFWEMGETGPCGPCSEIHIDLGADDGTPISADPVKGVNGSNDRFIELWNLVFIQYNRMPDGSLQELPAKHVDTGAGLERLLSYLQGVRSSYDTDLFKPIIERVAQLSGKPYGPGAEGVSHRVMADHIRTLVFSIADNVMPSNEGRGYVLRRLLRRALRYAGKLDIHEPVLYKLVPVVVEIMGPFFDHLPKRQAFIADMVKAEEESFLKTLDEGVRMFGDIAAAMKKSRRSTVSGEDAFKLYDTYGFPFDLTRVMAKEEGFAVDEAGFEAAMERRKAQSRKDSKLPGQRREEAVLSREDHDALVRQLTDLHHGEYRTVAMGGEARILSDAEEKRAMARHHTATHLLHAALREVLGDHVQQAGSLVDTDRLRFDFTHFKAMDATEIKRVEEIVNDKIRAALPVTIHHTTLDKAKALGAMALFGEKYDEGNVRVVTIPGFSTELCGGTHTQNTAAIEQLIILSESAVSAGVRRIEAIAGNETIRRHVDAVTAELKDRCLARLSRLDALAEALNRTGEHLTNGAALRKLDGLSVAELETREKEIIETIKTVEKELSRLKDKKAGSQVADLLEQATPISGSSCALLAQHLRDFDIPMMRVLADNLVSANPNLVVVLASEKEGKTSFLVKLAKNVPGGVVDASKVIETLTGVAGGKGGGRKDMAQAGGAEPAKTEQALKTAAARLNELFNAIPGA